MIIQQISNRIAIARCDALVKNNIIAGYWKITSTHNKKVNEGEVSSDK